MILIEKVKPVGINTDISPEAVESGNDGNRVVINPVLDGLNRHYYTSENEAGMKSENIKGTVLKSNSLPSGDNVCIGTWEDKLNNKLIFFNCNSNDDHGVYAYSPETDAITELIQTDLGFQNDRRYLITGVGSIGNLLYWTDGIGNQYSINMTRDYSYGTFSLRDILVLKMHPIIRVRLGESDYYDSPNLDRKYDSAIKTNIVTDTSYQFSYRYKFLDEEYSVIAPYSNLSFADFDPDPFNTTKNSYTYNNEIRVRITLPTTPNAFIKNVELLVREDNDGNWKIWKTIVGVTSNIDVYFTGSEARIDLDQTETSKLFESIPNYSKALAIQKNRLFLTSDAEGFDVNDTITIALTEKVISTTNGSSTSSVSLFLTGFKVFVAATGTYVVGERIKIVNTDVTKYAEGIVTSVVGTTITFYADKTNGIGTYSVWTVYPIAAPSPPAILADYNKTYFKANGVYVFGISVFDKDQKCMGVVSKTKFNASPTSGGTVSGGTLTYYGNGSFKDIFLKAVLSGNFSTSPDIKYYSLVVTNDQYYEQYTQIMVKPFFYLFEKPEGFAPNPGTQVEVEGKVMSKDPATTKYNRIYLQMPQEMPVVVDTSYYVRLMNSSLGASVNKILDIVGDFIVIADFGLNVSQVALPFLAVEVFKPRESTDGLFYEITDRYSVDNSGLLSVTTIDNIYGDNYRPSKTDPPINISGTDYPLNYLQQTFRVCINDSLPSYLGDTNRLASPLINPEMPTPTTVSSIKDITLVQVQAAGVYKFQNRLIIPDYQKIAWNQGKLIVEVTDKKKFTRPSVIRFSNKYIQDTNINGLSSFDAGNQYPVSFDRGPINKLQPLGNRMLAIHERATTVLYTEEKMLRNADGTTNVIAAPETAIGYDTKMDGDYGCHHPESIVAIENAVFGFDIYKGVVWRYTVEGQFQISDYGRREYFRGKQILYMSNIDGVKIIGGHDPFHKEYIITFNDGTETSETIAFNYIKNIWTIRYSFIPEYYGKINNKLVSFKNGALWVHNESNTYNNFYGVQYGSFLKLAINPHPTKTKNYAGIDLGLESLSSDVDFKQVELWTENGQYSYLKVDEWDKLQNRYYADILKDVNTQADVIPGLLALREGDDIRSLYLILQVNDDKTTKNSMQMLNLNYVLSEYSI